MLKNIKNRILGNYSTDTALRYKPVVEIIRKYKLTEGSILEIGSGDYGLTTYLNKRITGADIFFAPGEENDLLNKVKINGAVFPFSDNQFDLTVSVDNLEHLPAATRENFIKEIIRVTKKYIIIVVPCGRLAQRQDEILNDFFIKVNNKKDKFLAEHLACGLPGLYEIDGFIKSLDGWQNKNLKIIFEKKLTNLSFRNFYMHSKISPNFLLKIFYYFILLFLPLRKLTDYGDCYRKMYFIEIN